jgi:type II secretory pathway pseudopilin PulG
VRRDVRAGISLLELVVVLALIGVMMTMAVSTLGSWADDQRAATSARNVADAFGLARAEALRTGNNHIVAFDIATGLDGITGDVVVVNDGPPATANCVIQTGEVRHTVSLETGVSFGSAAALSNNTKAPDDSGAATNKTAGSSFTNATTGAASWVFFGPDGMPRRFTQNGSTSSPCTATTPVGSAGGAIYVTNGHRDYGAVLSPLGTVRLHRWISGDSGWTK